MSGLAGETIQKLRDVVGEAHVRTDLDSLASYGRDTCDMFEGRPSAVVLPASTTEVQGIVQLANRLGFALVPSGGRTGLSGGATAAAGEVVLALERMNRILDASAIDRTIRCQAGVVIASLQQQAESMGLYFPIDYASAGSSQVGGCIATNAGGNRVIRYGMTRQWVAAAQVVTGAGDVIELGRALLKDNTGYDLLQLMIGSEGTLGVITEATMRLTDPPAASTVMVLGLDSLDPLTEVLKVFRGEVTLNAFEFFTEDALSRVVARHGLERPFEPPTPVYALLEFESPSERELDAALSAFERCREAGWVRDGTVSHSGQQARALWRLREDISGTLAQWQPYKNDLSVRVSQVPAFLREAGELVHRHYPDFEVLWYGHIGDGNVHLNILKPGTMNIDEFQAHCGQVSEEIFEVLQRHGGSISAEHGVGLLKKPYLGYTRSELEIGLMRTIKSVLDPNGIMNPGKVF